MFIIDNMPLKGNVKKIITNPALLGFLHGVFIVTLLFFGMEYLYSQRIYQEIAERATKPEMTQEEKALVILNTVYNLLEPRTEFFGGRGNIPFGPLKVFNASRTILTFGGACGDYVHVLGRALKAADINIQVVQMKVGDIYGGHIIAEVLINDRWVILDPIYNLYFRNPDGSLATFSEISGNWQYFQKQVPSNYNPEYAYEGMRRTNWGKIPVLLPLAKKILNWMVGPEIREEISLRAYVLDVWFVYIIFLSLLYGAFILWTIKVWRNLKKKKLNSSS